MDNLRFRETDGYIFGDYGIETCDCVPEHKGTYYIVDTLRVLLELLEIDNFAVGQGTKNDYICNDMYTNEFYKKVMMLR